MLTEKAIEGYKVYTERTISHARYRLGSTWYTAQISRRERMKDGRVAVYFPIIPQTTEEVTIENVKSKCEKNIKNFSKRRNVLVKHDFRRFPA